MSLWSRIARRSVVELTRIACMLALAGLAIMAYSVISPRPLPVILAMSVGQMIGLAGVACYIVAVIVDAARQREPGSSQRPKPPAEEPAPRTETSEP